MNLLAEHPRARSNLLAAFGLVLMVLLWLVPSGAFAAEVSLNPPYSIRYVAAAGEVNDVAIDQGDGHITLTESGDGVPLTDGDGAGGCEVTDGIATCPDAEADYVYVAADDGDDTVDVDPAITMYTSLNGGAGADALTGGGGPKYISGGEGDDTIVGGGGTAGIFGGEGNESIVGTGGADNIYGDAGDDQIEGGDGNDYLDDGAGNDVVSAGAGLDEFVGDVGDDVFNGDAGDDYFNGFDYTGADVFNGGAGNDWLDYRRVRPLTVDLDGVADDGENCPGDECEGDNAARDIETLSGGMADDRLVGNELANSIAGEGASDTIVGFDGDDELLGDWGWSANAFGAGDDTIDGGEGDDWLFGDYGADSLTGGPGVDGLNGSAGNDELDSNDGGGRDADGCGSGSDRVSGDAGDVVAGDCENVFGAIVGGPAGLPGPQGAPGPAGERGPRGPRGRPARVVRISRVTRSARQLRFVAISTDRGVVTVKVRKAGRVVGSARRPVQAGREFTLKVATGEKARGGRYTLTTTLRSDDERWTRSERVMVR
jgi:Ca2+-binding RTX toxin-like protein